MSTLQTRIFGFDFQDFVDSRISQFQIDAEVDSIKSLVETFAPGPRVMILGCGFENSANEQGRNDFLMTASGCVESSIRQAPQFAKREDLSLDWRVVDLFPPSHWPDEEADAVVVLRSLGLVNDARQRAILRKLQNYLSNQGVLIVVQPSSKMVTDFLVVAEEHNWQGESFRVEQSFDSIYSRLFQRISVSLQPERFIQHEQRLYSTVELCELVRDSGFCIESVVEVNDKFASAVQLVARRIATPPDALAVATWKTPDNPQFEMRYAPDEADWLFPSPKDVWRQTIEGINVDCSGCIGFYAVDDPYYSERSAEVISNYFGCKIEQQAITFGAGVTSLLHSLSALADRGLVLAPSIVHPDLDAWAIQAGAQCRFVDHPCSPNCLIGEIIASQPNLVHFDRPNFLGCLWSDQEIKSICKAAEYVGAIVLIDESPASCLGPTSSAVQIVGQVSNLVVLRGMTKAYSCGGLRTGFAIAADAIAKRVRQLAPPLQISEPAFQFALNMLSAGDVFSRFRERIKTTKPLVIELLESLGIGLFHGHPELPWLVACDVDGSAVRILNRLGIRGLSPPPLMISSRPRDKLLHLSLPHSDERIAQFQKLVSSGR